MAPSNPGGHLPYYYVYFTNEGRGARKASGSPKILEKTGGGARIPTSAFRLQNLEHTAFPTGQAIELDVFFMFMWVF